VAVGGYAADAIRGGGVKTKKGTIMRLWVVSQQTQFDGERNFSFELRSREGGAEISIQIKPLGLSLHLCDALQSALQSGVPVELTIKHAEST